MTHDFINELVKEAANKIKDIVDDTPTVHVPSLVVKTNLKTGERVPFSSTRKFAQPTTYSDCFVCIHTISLQNTFNKEVLPFINLDIAEIPLIGAKKANKYYLDEVEKNRLRVLEIRYEMRTKSDDELNEEELEAEIQRCRIDQIREQMYADFYKLAIDKLSNPKPTTRQYALYYYYLQESGEYPQFPNGQKLAKCQEISKNHGINSKNFQMDYNSISDRKKGHSERSRIPNDTKAVIKMLSNHPKAQDKARLDLDPFENR